MDYYTIFNDLGIGINQFSSISSVAEGNIFFIEAALKRKEQSCPYCNNDDVYLKERKKKTIKTVFANGAIVLLEIKCPRYLCLNCRKTFTQNPEFNYSQRKGRKFINAVLRECLKIQTYKDIAERLNSTPTEIMKIFDKYHEDYREEISEYICIDEFSNTKKSESKYACIIINFFSHKIVHILPDRKLDFLREYFRKQPKNILKKVKAICIDMYDGYITIAKEFMPFAIIVIDPFHYMRYFTEALQNIRRRLTQEIEDLHDKTWINKHWRFFTERSENLPKENIILLSGESISYYDRITRFVNQNYQLSYSYHLLQDFYFDFDRADFEKGKDLITNTINRMATSGIPELIECSKTWEHYKPYIQNSFRRFNNKRMSNGPIEGINSRVKTFKKVICGYKNFKRFYERIIYIINSKKGKDF